MTHAPALTVDQDPRVRCWAQIAGFGDLPDGQQNRCGIVSRVGCPSDRYALSTVGYAYYSRAHYGAFTAGKIVTATLKRDVAWLLERDTANTVVVVEDELVPETRMPITPFAAFERGSQLRRVDAAVAKRHRQILADTLKAYADVLGRPAVLYSQASPGGAWSFALRGAEREAWEESYMEGADELAPHLAAVVCVLHQFWPESSLLGQSITSWTDTLVTARQVYPDIPILAHLWPWNHNSVSPASERNKPRSAEAWAAALTLAEQHADGSLYWHWGGRTIANKGLSFAPEKPHWEAFVAHARKRFAKANLAQKIVLGPNSKKIVDLTGGVVE